jgi:hypothetical protein
LSADGHKEIEMEDKGVNAMDSSKVAKNDEPIANASEDVKWGTAQIPCTPAPDSLKNATAAGK